MLTANWAEVMTVFEAFFAFHKTPFQRDLAVKDLFTTPAHAEMVSRLKYIAEKRCFGLITGEVGAGKTTALRKLVALLNPNKYKALYISDSALTPRNFYWEALRQLDYEPRFYRGDAKRQLHKAVLELKEQGKVPVVIVDEAHLLGKEMLEEIRFLLNFNMDSMSPMSLILTGQPELRRILQLNIYEAIAQRINIRYHLPAMDRAETQEYILHHLKIAGATGAIFTDAAIDVIYEYSGGIARKVNNVCQASLLHAALGQKRLIDDHMIKVVIENEFAV